MVKKKEETKIDPNKCKINYNYFAWEYYEHILKYTSRSVLFPSDFFSTNVNYAPHQYFDLDILPFKTKPKLQIYLNSLKHMNILYKVFKNYEIHYEKYKELKTKILKKYSKEIDGNYVLMKDTEEGKTAINEIKILENQIHILPFDKINPKYFIFTFYYMFTSFGIFLPGTKTGDGSHFHGLKSFGENEEWFNIPEGKSIAQSPYFAINIFDFLNDIFDMNEFDKMQINQETLGKVYSEL